MKTKQKIGGKEFVGESVLPAIATGKVYLFRTALYDFPQYWISDVEVQKEIIRFLKAVAQCRKHLDRMKSKLCRIQGREQIGVLESHMLLLQDEFLISHVTRSLEEDRINAEWALHKTLSELRETFSKINQAYLRDRRYDIDYIENALLRSLLGKELEVVKKIPRGSIVAAPDFSPAEILYIARYKIAGIITERGSVNTHAAIVMRALGIPSILGVEGILRILTGTETAIIDGYEGKVILEPLSKTLKNYQVKHEDEMSIQKEFQKEAQGEARTADGFPIKILANVELEDELGLVEDSGAEGIGLYRTEFLFLEQEEIPSLEMQKKVYSRILRALPKSEAMIRTLDLGADKVHPSQQYINQENPALGLRSIRFSLHDKEMFTDQLRALIQSASGHGKLKICFPMISSVDEMRRVRRIFSEVVEELPVAERAAAQKIPLGAMIETPAAVIEMDLLAEEVEFFSVGTNDLIQFLLAVDRSNELVSSLYHPLHPSVVRTLKRIADTARDFGKEVTFCGEMASDPLYLMLLMGLGFNRLSMNAASIPKIKKIIRRLRHEDAVKLALKVLASDSRKESQKIVAECMSETVPEYFTIT